jgi:hypothetical protein
MSRATPTNVLDTLLTKHPREIGESYGEHAGHALYIGMRMLGASIVCLVHAVLPGLFVRTASHAVEDIQALMTKRTAPTTLDEQIA